MDTNVLRQMGRAAIGEHVSQPAVAFVPGERGELASIASGTLFETLGRNVVVLTAKHCLDEVVDGPIRLVGFRSNNALAGRSPAVAAHPSASVDVGMFALWPEASGTLRGLALPLDQVAVDDAVDAATCDLVIAGYPKQMVVAEGSFRGLTGINYLTGLGQPPTDAVGRLRVLWTEMETPDGIAKMPHPGGTSGGAVWRFQKPPKGIWSPARSGSVIGVPVAWLESAQIEFAEPVSRWRDWFVSTAEEIDRLLKSQSTG
ncbi:MAG: hypothetical protein JST92_26825 [Deltaproteobacteria bacterium]|nr:hypothetical protein [Deltaproteobacteria bacterium]